MKFRKILALILSIGILIVPLNQQYSAATSWVGSSTYGWYANDNSSLSNLKSLMFEQTNSYMMSRFEKILNEYPLSGYFNSYKTQGCLWHCGSCGTRTSGCIDRFYDDEIGETVTLGGWQCFGYAEYCFYRFFKTFTANTITLSSGFSITTLKNTINDSLIGSHFRLNGHSMVYLAKDSNNIYFIDANSGYNSATGCVSGKCSTNNSHYSTECKINLRRFSWSEFTSRYSSKGVSIYAPVSVPGSDSSGSSVSITSYPDKNTITDTNAILWARVDKPSSYPVTKIGIKVRKEGDTYSNGWSRYDTPSSTYVGSTYMHPYYDLNAELGATLVPGTKYWLQFYAVVNGKEYWTSEEYFYTTGTHTHSYPSTWTTVTASTCTTEGTAKRTCTSCGNSETKSLTKLGHNYSTTWTIDKDATCGEVGSKSYHCTRCSSKSNVTEIPATGEHTYSYFFEEYPTELKDGTFIKDCENCSNDTSYSIPYMKIENIIFTDDKIECRVLKPEIDADLSHMVAVLYTVDGESMPTSISENEKYEIFTLEDISSFENSTEIKLELYFGAGEIPYSIYIYDTQIHSLKNICNDINGDGSHNAADLTQLKGKLIGSNEIRTGDANADGNIDIRDLISLKKYLAEI